MKQLSAAIYQFDWDLPYPVRCTACKKECGQSSHPDIGSAMCGECFGWHSYLAAVLQG